MWHVKAQLQKNIITIQITFSTWSRAIGAILTSALKSALNFRQKNAKNLAPQVATRLRRAATFNVQEHFFHFFISFFPLSKVIGPWILGRTDKGPPLTATADAQHRLQSSSQPSLFYKRVNLDLT